MKKNNKTIMLKRKYSKVVYLITSFILISILIWSPKQILEYQDGIEIAYSLSSVNSENLLFYDYKVYPTKERFEKGLIYDVDQKLQEFKNRNEFMVIKIYSSNNNIYLENEYLIIESNDIPELNIEYYLLRDLEIQQISLPIRTFLVLFEDISKIINSIYLGFLMLFAFITIPTSILKTIGLSYYIVPVTEPQNEINLEKNDESN